MTDSVRTCPGLNRFLGLDSPEQWLDVGADRFLSHVHPEDRAWMRQEQPLCAGATGQGVLVYRMLDHASAARWVLSRGVFVTEGGVLASGEGVLLDVTAWRSDESSCRIAPAPLSQPLFRLIDAATEAHGAAKQVGDRSLIVQTELLLMTAARKLAGGISADELRRLH